MKLHLDNPSGEFRISAYADNAIIVNQVSYAHALVVRVDAEPERWAVSDLSALTGEALQALLQPPPEVLLLGTGARQQFPEGEVLGALYTAGVGFEIMDSAAACRTFNILAAEGRRVVAALLLPAQGT